MRPLWTIGIVASLTLAIPTRGYAEDALTDSDWRMTISTPYYGELDGLFHAGEDGRYITLASRSQLASQLARQPSTGNWFPEETTLAFRLRPNGSEAYSGRFATLQGSFRRGYSDANLVLRDGVLGGSVASGTPFSGSIEGYAYTQTTPLRRYTDINATIEQHIYENLFDPRLLEDSQVLDALQLQQALANEAIDDFDLILTYALTAPRLPFSHFGITRPSGGLPALLDERQTRGVASDQVSLTYIEDIAVLTIRSFVGNTITQQITDAFHELSATDPRGLIIDLRDNGGGSLAGAALANNLLSERIPIGVFVSNQWWRNHDEAPGLEAIEDVAPFSGSTLQDFYNALDDGPLLPVSSQPVPHPFTGPTYVLSSTRSTSMTELFLDAMLQTGRAIVIGEVTPGEMLSSRFFDVGDGFVLRLPIADYYSLENGRLEGVGVTPNVQVPAEDALEYAFDLARNNVD